ncbi:MAG: DoxX family protein [Casimicrobiaceae bacterium]
MNQRSDGLALLGRVLLAVLFIVSGWGKIGDFAGTAAGIAGKGLPMPDVLTALAIAVELGGGLLLLVGWKARWIGLALAAFTVVITPIFHGFWSVPAAEAMAQQVHFLKNVAIIGGLLMVAAMGPGRFSIDRG